MNKNGFIMYLMHEGGCFQKENVQQNLQLYNTPTNQVTQKSQDFEKLLHVAKSKLGFSHCNNH